MSNARTVVVALMAWVGTGCEQWKAPARVSALEKKVEALRQEVQELKGAVGRDEKDEEHAKPAAKHGEEVDHGDRHASAGPARRSHPHWSYDGDEGPEHWGELDERWATCGEGRAQSPIDIVASAASSTPIEFDYQPTAATVVDNGHTVQVDLAAGSSIAIDGHTYQLVQFHVHTPSEHVIAGERFPMELHLVHKDAEGKLAVVGVMYDAGAASAALAGVWAKWPRKTDVPVKLRKRFDPAALLPDKRTVYRYDGSLTTPPCSEGVVWNVMRRTVTDSRRNLDLLRLRYTTNARPAQPLNGREVL